MLRPGCRVPAQQAMKNSMMVQQAIKASTDHIIRQNPKHGQTMQMIDNLADAVTFSSLLRWHRVQCHMRQAISLISLRSFCNKAYHCRQQHDCYNKTCSACAPETSKVHMLMHISLLPEGE